MLQEVGAASNCNLADTDGLNLIDHIETSAAWLRPPLRKLNAQTDSIGMFLLAFDLLAYAIHSIPAD